VPTTLTANRTIGATSISCAALTGWNSGTVHFVIYSVDTAGKKVAGSQMDCKGIVSGTTISSLQYKAGTDAGHSIGAVVQAAPTAAWADDMTDGMLAEHSATGAHDVTKVGMLTGTQTYTGAKTFTGAVTVDDFTATGTVDLSDDSIKPENLVAGTGTGWAWQSWTPTWTNMTVGSATVVAKYKQIGKTVNCYLRFVVGAGTAVGTDPTFTLPVTPSSTYTLSQNTVVGLCRLEDAGVSAFDGVTYFTGSPLVGSPRPTGTAGNYATQATISGTIPFTWGTGDFFNCVFTYEAA
jgi:hypothetical protein